MAAKHYFKIDQWIATYPYPHKPNVKVMGRITNFLHWGTEAAYRIELQDGSKIETPGRKAFACKPPEKKL